MVKILIAQLEKWANDKSLADRHMEITLRSGIIFVGKIKGFSTEDRWLKLGDVVIDITEVAAYKEGF